MPKPATCIAIDSHSQTVMLHPSLLDGAHCSRVETASCFVSCHDVPRLEKCVCSEADLRRQYAFIQEWQARFLANGAMAASFPDLEGIAQALDVRGRCDDFQFPEVGNVDLSECPWRRPIAGVVLNKTKDFDTALECMINSQRQLAVGSDRKPILDELAIGPC